MFTISLLTCGGLCLSSMLKKQTKRGCLHGVKIAKGCRLLLVYFSPGIAFSFFVQTKWKHISFALCCVIMLRGSGHIVNYEKSAICFSRNCKEDIRLLIENVLSIRQDDTSGKYFGLPLVIGRTRRRPCVS